MTHLTLATFAEALFWGALAAGLVWLALYPVRRRSLTGLVSSLVLVGAAASAGLIWGAVHSMLLPGYDWTTIAVLTGFSVVVTGLAGVSAGRRMSRDHAALRIAAGAIGRGQVPVADGTRLSAEVERVRAELQSSAERLAEARDREQTLESSRRELVAWVSHDLRTPLAGLRAMAEALEDGVVEDPDAYYKQMVLSVERLDRMVGDLFELSRIQAGTATGGAETVALDDLVSDGLAALAPLGAARGVELVGDVPAPVRVHGDSAALNRALTNLVANAIRHTAPGDRVRVEMTTVPGGWAEVDVTDGCGGIAPEHLDRVFDVGFRGEPARTPVDGPHDAGAGLGLAITRGIVESHQGTIAVENVGRGCRFRLRLPVVT